MPFLTDAEIRAASIRKYRHRAAGYDQTCGPTWPIRTQAIEGLGLQPGDRVLDVGCGTGLSLALLREKVGDAGQVFGFDQSPEMLVQAQNRIREANWRNVQVFECSAQTLRLPAPVDALLFHYTHDILRSAEAIGQLLAWAKPQARVAIAGIKYFPAWLAPLNLWVYLKNYGYNGAPGDLWSPWDRIAPYLEDFRRQSTQWGMGYLAFGRIRA
ncbi:MAG: class I SAM-dependent methyltransferase [Burkholderiaceae bacterium]|jgi:ubiquinone/menaquinone biosynthesis C-methylase UbiE